MGFGGDDYDQDGEEVVFKGEWKSLQSLFEGVNAGKIQKDELPEFPVPHNGVSGGYLNAYDAYRELRRREGIKL